jgi:hypothetical protein
MKWSVALFALLVSLQVHAQRTVLLQLSGTD